MKKIKKKLTYEESYEKMDRKLSLYEKIIWATVIMVIISTIFQIKG